MGKHGIKQTRGEEIANSISHGVMALFGVAVLIALIIKSGSDPYKLVGAVIYGLSVTLMYIFSCIYHALGNNKAKWQVFKRLDHCSIYLLIGGTYAPVLLNLSSIHNWMWAGLSAGLWILMVQWIVIVIGITCLCIWINKYRWLHIVFYLLLGWSAVIFIKDVYVFNHIFFWLILGGGVCYTVGVIFYATAKVYYFHFIWHIFTMMGTVLQAVAILMFIYI